MSYSLFLQFEPAISEGRLLRYFGTRQHFAVKDGRIWYENPDTGSLAPVPAYVILDAEVVDAARQAVEPEPGVVEFPVRPARPEPYRP